MTGAIFGPVELFGRHAKSYSVLTPQLQIRQSESPKQGHGCGLRPEACATGRRTGIGPPSMAIIAKKYLIGPLSRPLVHDGSRPASAATIDQFEPHRISHFISRLKSRSISHLISRSI